MGTQPARRSCDAPHFGHAIERRLDEAAGLCAQRGERLTPLRRRVLQIVMAADRPLGAYDVLGRLAAERGRVAPPTVYRSLDFLVDQGLVHKVLSVNGFVACSTATRPHDAQLFICGTCGSSVEIPKRTAARTVEDEAKSLGFTIESVVLEVRGCCSTCRGSAAS